MDSNSNNTSIFPERLVTYASFGRRFAAALIDGVVLGIPLAFLNMFLFKVPSQSDPSNFLSNIGKQYLMSMLVSWLYYALQEAGSHQATLGKRAMEIKVTNLQGQRISFAAATGRYFSKYISGLILFIGYLMVLWDDKKQALHDKIAGTLVVKV